MATLWGFNPGIFSTLTLERMFRTPMGAIHADVEVVSAEGFGGGSALTGSTYDAYIAAMVRPQDDEYFRFGQRIRIDNFPPSPFLLLSAIDQDFAHQVSLILNPDGTLQVMGSTAIGSPTDELTDPSTNDVPLALDFALGFRGRVSRVAGEVEVYVGDAISDLNRYLRMTGINTASTDQLTWNGIYIGLGPNIFVSNPYALDGPGETKPGLLVAIHRPDLANEDEQFGEWESSEATVEGAINDITPDDSGSIITGMITGSPVDHRPRFAVPVESVDADDVITVYGVMPVAVLQSVDPTVSPMTDAVSTFEFLAFLSNAERYGGLQSVVGEWPAIWHMFDVDPRTGLPWAAAAINAPSKFGGRMQT